jgi:hypothetical protein
MAATFAKKSAALTLESCFADSRQDYIVKLIEDAEAAQLRYQSPKQFRPELIVMNNAIMSPTATPMIVPAATPRQSTFCSLAVISTSQRQGKPYHIPKAHLEREEEEYEQPERVAYATDRKLGMFRRSVG